MGRPPKFLPYLLAFILVRSAEATEPAPAPSPKPPASTPAIQPLKPSYSPGDVAKRESVRGAELLTHEESPELAELRRFEELALKRGDQAALGVEYRLDTLPERLAWVRTLRSIGVPVRWDQRLIKYLEFFRNEPRGQAILRHWYSRSGRMRPLIEDALSRHNLPRELVAVAMIESGFAPQATSRVGAGGIWQMMPGTASVYGLRIDTWVDERRDFERATEAALMFFSDLFARFGSADLAIASYNAGYYAILKALRKYSSNDFWQLCRYEAGLPWETCNYVPKALAVALALQNPEAFGLKGIALDPPLRFERMRVRSSAKLARIAALVGTSVERLRDLNPELRQARTPPGGYDLRIPPGSKQAVADAEKALGSEATDAPTSVVKLGEDLGLFARRHGVSEAIIRSMNDLPQGSIVKAGTQLFAPRLTNPTEKKAQVVETGATLEEEADLLLVGVPEHVKPPVGTERVFYRVVAGDRVDEIATGLEVELDDLCKWNDLDLHAHLAAGMILQAFVDPAFDKADVNLLDPKGLRVASITSPEFLELAAQQRGRRRIVYKARGGETMAKLGRRYGLTAGDLGRINRLANGAVLTRGQEVVIYEPVTQEARQQGRARVAQADHRHRKFSRARSRGSTRRVSAVKSSSKSQRPHRQVTRKHRR